MISDDDDEESEESDQGVALEAPLQIAASGYNGGPVRGAAPRSRRGGR